MATKPQIAGVKPEASKPSRWWQWILLYPAFAISLVTSVPDWADKALAKYNNVKQDKYSDALRQAELYRTNINCTAAPIKYSPNENNVNVDATICRKTGDIFVQVLTADQRKTEKWVDLAKILSEGKPSSGAMIPSANATVPRRPALYADQISAGEGTKIKNVQLAQATNDSAVVCQKFIDTRLLLRHIRTPQGCYDEIIDTFNGVVVRRTEVPCRGGC